MIVLFLVQLFGRPTSHIESELFQLRPEGLTSDTVSAILRRTMTTARRRRAKAETVTLFSISEGFAPVSGGLGVSSCSGIQGQWTRGDQNDVREYQRFSTAVTMRIRVPVMSTPSSAIFEPGDPRLMATLRSILP
jgi:hypothetical protein